MEKPKKVYLDWDKEPDLCYMAHDDPARLVVHSETMRVGVYELVGEVEIRNVTLVEPVRTPKKKSGKKRATP